MTRSIYAKIMMFAGAWVFLVPVPGALSSSRFSAELEAPDAIKAALLERLDIFRWKKDPATDASFFTALYNRTPAQAETVLREHGYFSPEVKSRMEIENGVHAAFFKIDPGEPARVSSLEISISGEILERPYGCPPKEGDISEAWLLPEGARFTQAKWETSKRRLLRLFLVSCYPAARIAESRALVDPGTFSAQLSVHIDSGPAFTLGDLDISGLEKYPEELVHNLNFIRPGSPHSREKLSGLQNRLQQSGYFEYAHVSIPHDPEFHENVPVRVNLEEKKRREIRMGIEISSDTGGGAKFEYRDSNLRRRGLKLKNVLQANRPEQLFYSDLQMPTRPNGTYDNYSFTASSSDFRREELNLLRLGFSRTRPMGTFLRIFKLQYSRETRRLPGEERSSLLSLAPGVSWSARETDHLLYPGSGYLLDIHTAGAFDGVFSDASFAHVNVKGKLYRPLGPRGTAILRFDAGNVFAGTREGIPSEFLFRTGGTESIRGYRYRSIGVLEHGAVVGGRGLLTGGLEYSRDTGGRWGAAVFIDGGSAHDDWSGYEPVFGYGAGLRLKTAAGPVNLDIAYGEEDKRLRLHFTMGVVF